MDKFDDSSYTFLGYGNSVSKWLDHVLGKEHDCIKEKNISILQSVFGSDHFPLDATLDFAGCLSAIPPLVPSTDKDTSYEISLRIMK